MRWLALAIAVVSATAVAGADSPRTIAGSLQLDYLAVPSDAHARAIAFDGMTAEVALRMSVDFTSNASVSVKVCFACHGFEAAAAYVDLRAADELSVRVGRLTPEFGGFPQRGDPSIHRSSDKPLPYDMGRMLHHAAWNEGVLPAPWVDTGAELLGTRFVDGGRIDYAGYVLSGPKGTAETGDLDFVASRDPGRYYVDNNSEPVGGLRLAGTLDLDSAGHGVTVGASAMAGHYDPDRRLGFWIAGGDAAVTLDGVTLRGEYLVRRTEVAGRGNDFTKHGFYAEAELPIGRVDAFARFDGLLRFGSVPLGSPLSSSARLLRYTGGAAIRLSANIRLKASVELYQSDDLGNDVALHLGLATPF